jgi:hypothetical protein
MGFGVLQRDLTVWGAETAGKDGQPVLSKYDLVANILHDGKAGEGTYRAHIHRKSEDAWCARCASSFLSFSFFWLAAGVLLHGGALLACPYLYAARDSL